MSSRRAGVRPPSDGVSGRWPTGRSPASRSSTARSSGSSSASVPGRSAGSGSRSSVGPAAQPRGMADGAADRVGGAQDVVAPQQRAGGEPLQRRPPARRRGRRAARRRSRRGPRRRSGPAARRRAPAAWRRPARRARGRPTPGRRAGWPAPPRRTAPGGRRRAGPPAGRSAARRCGCAARRRASQGGPWASGPRYVVAASDAAASMEGCRPQPRTPGPVPTWTRYQAGALRWLAGGVIAVVLGVLLGVAVVAVAENSGRRIPGAGPRRRRARPDRHRRGGRRRRRPAARRTAGAGAWPRRPGRPAGCASPVPRSSPSSRPATTSSTPTTSRCGCGCSAPRSGGRGPCSGWTAPRCGPRPWAAGEWVLTADGLDTVIGARTVAPEDAREPVRGSVRADAGAATGR